MGMGRAEEIGLRLTGTVYVVGVAAAARDEPLVLKAQHARADSGTAHLTSPSLIRHGEEAKPILGLGPRQQPVLLRYGRVG